MSNVPLHLLLGNIPTPPTGAIENWLIAFAAIVAIINQAYSLLKNFKNSPQFIQLQESFVSRGSFHKHAELNRDAHKDLQTQINALRDKTDVDKKEIIRAGEDRAERIQDRISEGFESIEGDLGELRGSLGIRKRVR